jgi:hypothetical protein
MEHAGLGTAQSAGTPTQSQFWPNSALPARAAVGHGPGRVRDTDGARAETLIGAEASSPLSAPRGKAARIAALSALIAVAGGGAWFFSQRNVGTTNPMPETRAAAAAVPIAPPLPAMSAAALASDHASVTPAVGIRLDVATEPSGAILLKNGFQVCDRTPCEVVVAPAETIEFQASKGPLKGAAKVLAQRDQKVTIKLLGPPGSAAPKPAAQRLCEVEVDGLKILRACK